MIRNRKMSTIMAISIAFVTLVCMGFLYLTIHANTTSAMRTTVVENMCTALDGQANIIKQYVDESERTLKEYTSSKEITNLLKEPENSQYIQDAQNYTEKYFSNLESWEGIYLSNWNTTVLAHSNAEAVGMTTRKADELEAYQNSMTEQEDGLYNGGVFVSPASGQMILNLRMAIYDSDGKTPLGLVGGGPFIAGLGEILDRLEISGLQKTSYTIMDTRNQVYVFTLIMAKSHSQ